jgi:antitoxin component of RelBE/YafQ-DinJ toxin-antitoxin module
MAATHVNVRVDPGLRRQVDLILQDAGATTSELIQGLYRHIAETRRLPEFVAPDQAAEQARRQAKIARLRSAQVLAGVPEDYRQAVRRHAADKHA